MPDEKPEGIIKISLILTPSKLGYALHVEMDPADTYPDTVIDACRRAAHFFENRSDTLGIIAALEQYRLAREQAARLGGRFH